MRKTNKITNGLAVIIATASIIVSAGICYGQGKKGDLRHGKITITNVFEPFYCFKKDGEHYVVSNTPPSEGEFYKKSEYDKWLEIMRRAFREWKVDKTFDLSSPTVNEDVSKFIKATKQRKDWVRPPRH
ncbi:MAG: hypothetical protein KAX20_06705 [Candidatus Omnitrophica bacterium]|nr:hypothetical protein [Candidatus Omnitrophota bacterium]